MSQRNKYVVTCIIRADLTSSELRKFVETTLGSSLHNAWNGDLEVVKIKEAVPESTAGQQERKDGHK